MLKKDPGYESQKPFSTLDDKGKTAFLNKLKTWVANGLSGKQKDSLLTYLTASARGREKFACINRIVVELSPPAKMKNSSLDLQIEANDATGVLTAYIKYATVADGKPAEGWGPKTDAALSLMCLTDSYLDKARLVVSQATAETAQLIGTEGITSVGVDWSFTEEQGYAKMTEEQRASCVAQTATALKQGMLERASGLARHLARSQRAQKVLSGERGIREIKLWVSTDNRCKAPFELSEDGPVLRVGVSANKLDQAATAGWGPAVDDRFALLVVDEEGMRQVVLAVQQHQQLLPQGTRLEVDWSVCSTDRWRKMKPEEKQGIFTSMCKKMFQSGLSDRKDGLVSMLMRSPRAKSIFTQKCGVLRIRLEAAGAAKPMLLDQGVVVVPVLLNQVDSGPAWGPLIDPVLGLRIDDEEAIKKAEAALMKINMAGITVRYDWSFMDDPAIVRLASDKRAAIIAGFQSIIQAGLGGRQGLSSQTAAMSDTVEHLYIRVSPAVKGKGGVDCRLGDDKVLEYTIKQQAVVSGNSAEDWVQLFKGLKGSDGGSAAPLEVFHLLQDGDSNAICSVENIADPLPNPLIDDGVAQAYTETPMRASAGTAPTLKEVVNVAPPPVKAAAPPPVKAAAPPPVKAAPPPAVKAASPPPAKPPASPAPVKMTAPEGTPADFGCPAAWDQCAAIVQTINKSIGSACVLEIDWDFVESSQFTALPDPQKKAVVSNLNTRIFTPLSKDLVKVVKSNPMYSEPASRLKLIRYRYEPKDSVMDMASGKQAKTHYSVQLLDDGATLLIVQNLSQHMTGISPALEGKIQVAFGIQHLVIMEEARVTVAKRGTAAKLECFLDVASFIEHPNFYKPPITMDSIVFWQQVAREADTAADRLLKAIDANCKDPIFGAAFKSRFSSVLVQPDPANGVRDLLAPPTWSVSENKELYQLVFRFNMNDGAQAAQAAPAKLNALLDVKLQQAIAASVKDANEQISKFKTTLPGVEMVLIDFFNTPQFQALKVDVAVAGCQALKPWLAGIHRQLGLIIQRNAAVVKAKTKVIQFGLDPANSIKGANDCDVTLDSATGTLRIVQNMLTATKPDASVSQRVDGLLDVTMANVSGEVAAEMKTRSQALSTALRIPGISVNIDFSFENDPAFSSLQPQIKQAKVKRMRQHLETILDSMIKFGSEACGGLKTVLLCADGANPINDPFSGATDADHYLCFLDHDGNFRVTVNLESVDKQLGRAAHKVEQQFALFRARHDNFHDKREIFEWESLRYPQLLNDTILSHFELSLTHCKDVTKSYSTALEMSRTGSPAGKESVERLTKTYVRMDPNINQDWITVLTDDTSLCLFLSFPFVKDRFPLTVLEWKEALEWTLGSTVEVEKFHGQNRVAAAEAKLKTLLAKPVKITIDWNIYVDQPSFLKLGAAGCREHIRTLTVKFLNNVVDSITAIAKHPIGMKALKEKLNSLRFCYGPNVDTRQRLRQPCRVTVDEKGEALFNFRDLFGAAALDYKTRLEFEMSVISSVAEYDATARRTAVSSNLDKIGVTYDLGFTLTDEFRYGVSINKHASIVDAVVAGIPEHVWNNSVDGLRSIWSHPGSKKVKEVHINVDVSNKFNPVNGQLVFDEGAGKLTLTYDLGTVLTFSKSRNWRPRIASVLGNMDDIAMTECNAKLLLTEKALNLCKVTIDYKSFLSAPKWKALTAADRYERMHNLGGELARDVLLGYWGLTGLTEFPGVRQDFLNRVKLIELAVDPDASGPPYKTALNGTTLRLTFSINEFVVGWNQRNVGSRQRVEKTMNLRPLTEKCAIEAMEKQHVDHSRNVTKRQVKVFWEEVLKDPDYLGITDYVQYIKFVGEFIPSLLEGYDSTPMGVPYMLGNNVHAAEMFKAVKSFDIHIDGTCTVSPPQERFVNPFMKLSLEDGGSRVVITVRRDWMLHGDARNGNQSPPDQHQVHNGCSSNLAWLLAPGASEARENEMVELYRVNLMRLETERRNDLLDDHERTCRRNTDDYNDAMEEYARAATQDCYSCSGKGHWGRNFNRCSTCKGTGRRQASMSVPQMPHNPPPPTFIDMASIDFMGMALSETRWKKTQKEQHTEPDQPLPKAPTFTPQMCARWTSAQRESEGAEDKQPAGKSSLPGYEAYVPLTIQGDADNAAPTSSASSSGLSSTPKSPRAIAKAPPGSGRVPTPPPPPKK